MGKGAPQSQYEYDMRVTDGLKLPIFGERKGLDFPSASLLFAVPSFPLGWPFESLRSLEKPIDVSADDCAAPCCCWRSCAGLRILTDFW